VSGGATRRPLRLVGARPHKWRAWACAGVDADPGSAADRHGRVHLSSIRVESVEGDAGSTIGAACVPWARRRLATRQPLSRAPAAPLLVVVGAAWTARRVGAFIASDEEGRANELAVNQFAVRQVERTGGVRTRARASEPLRSRGRTGARGFGKPTVRSPERSVARFSCSSRRSTDCTSSSGMRAYRRPPKHPSRPMGLPRTCRSRLS
jgi:hypothetical protein